MKVGNTTTKSGSSPTRIVVFWNSFLITEYIDNIWHIWSMTRIVIGQICWKLEIVSRNLLPELTVLVELPTRNADFWFRNQHHCQELSYALLCLWGTLAIQIFVGEGVHFIMLGNTNVQMIKWSVPKMIIISITFC